MKLQSSVLLSSTLLAAAAHAFLDTSPFFLFSTSSSFASFPSSDIVHSSRLSRTLQNSLVSCPSDVYLVVSQPGVTIGDFAQPARGVPHLRNALNGTTNGRDLQAIIVPEVVGAVDANGITALLQDKCEARVVLASAATGEIPAEQAHPSLFKIDFPNLPMIPSERVAKLGDHDSFLHAILASLAARSYTVIYVTSPPTSPVSTPSYQMDSAYNAAPHQELKRNPASAAAADAAVVSYAVGVSAQHNPPLFQTYVFLSPALHMAIFALLPMLTVVYIGLSALQSLKVSYFAFSKEMGPVAQKKQ